MKLTAINVYNVDLPVVGSYRMATTSVSFLQSTVVELVTDNGITGFGETCPVGPVYQPQHMLGARAALEEIGPSLIGLEPRNIGQLNRAMDLALNGSRYAKAAIDIAAWDICGKSYGRRVCDLLGGATGETIPTYYSIIVKAPEEAAREARERQLEGYSRIQVKIGGRHIEEDIETLHRVQEALKPGMRLAADANRSLTSRDALFLSQRCRDISMVMEQPCNTMEEIAAIRHQLCHPVYMDELAEDVNGVMRAISTGLVDGFGLKLTRVGGISALATVRDICEARGLPHTCDDSWGGDIVAAACVHVGATVAPSRFEGAWIAAPYIEGHYDAENGIKIDGGRIKVPTGPGLGIMPDMSKLGSPIMSFG
ncbi:putative mandelate racemase/muconate lactonizing protein (plasmid) [Sinorhizobium fredii HH103]|uniref:Mandelate racemase/muconate lactonizing protein n=1 Tax=Sinorhizobium fredii (strain HH103) TaxID=1117943 RepID=G9AEB0_SINF1|nr:mandelate racemase/muconate lactonizing enzyme family protein [Sinorhizobium fredii]CCE99392.2 putative mandelate racemase/muconate lactonizing protein [Sinorhizobium fredii HH103]